MTWDATAYDITIHALGAVEASMDYGAIAPGIISIGLIQWYGTRAANLLFQIQSGDPTDFAGCPSSIVSAMTAHPATDTWWDGRAILNAEISPLQTMLRATNVQTIQITQAKSDVDGYLATLAQWGMDKDNNTQAVEFACNMYNQSPISAQRVIGGAGPQSSLDRLYTTALNDPVFSQYSSRYTQAYNIIKAQDPSTINVSGSGSPPNQGNPSGTVTNPYGNIYPRGRQLILTNPDGTKQLFQKAGGVYISGVNSNLPPSIVSDGGTPASGAAAAIISWENSVLGTFAYSQSNPGRLNPVNSGYCDCSGLQYYAFLKYGNVDIGTVTGTQIQHGTLITTSQSAILAGTGILPGDLIFYRWHASSPSTYDHVALLDGLGNAIGTTGNTGEDPGPNKEPVATDVNFAISGGGSVMVRRYL